MISSERRAVHPASPVHRSLLRVGGHEQITTEFSQPIKYDNVYYVLILNAKR